MASYSVIDNNKAGLAAFRGQDAPVPTPTYDIDILKAEVPEAIKDLGGVDVVISLGLIEHFSPKDTARVIDYHFDIAKSDGIIIMTFPTPTLLYRLARGGLEVANAWGFTDERPLLGSEVRGAADARGRLLRAGIHYKIILTQGYVVYKNVTK